MDSPEITAIDLSSATIRVGFSDDEFEADDLVLNQIEDEENESNGSSVGGGSMGLRSGWWWPSRNGTVISELNPDDGGTRTCGERFGASLHEGSSRRRGRGRGQNCSGFLRNSHRRSLLPRALPVEIGRTLETFGDVGPPIQDPRHQRRSAVLARE